ncbi:MAG: hypothetical protein R6V74_12220, partial [Lutibacter sp.]
MPENLDSLKINFDTEGLWVLNITLAIIMFGVALGITKDDFKRLFQNPKILFTGIISQFILLPLVTFIFIKLVTIDADSRMSRNMLTEIDRLLRTGKYIGGGVAVWPERWSLGIVLT